MTQMMIGEGDEEDGGDGGKVDDGDEKTRKVVKVRKGVRGWSRSLSASLGSSKGDVEESEDKDTL